MAARPILTLLKITGRDMPTVSSDMLDGFCSVVVIGATMNWFPPVPPLPVTETLLNPAVCPKELRPVCRSIHAIRRYHHAGLAFQARGYIEGDARNLDVANRCLCSHISSSLECEIKLCQKSNARKHLGKCGRVERFQRNILERDHKISNVTGRYASVRWSLGQNKLKKII